MYFQMYFSTTTHMPMHTHYFWTLIELIKTVKSTNVSAIVFFGHLYSFFKTCWELAALPSPYYHNGIYKPAPSQNKNHAQPCWGTAGTTNQPTLFRNYNIVMHSTLPDQRTASLDSEGFHILPGFTGFPHSAFLQWVCSTSSLWRYVNSESQQRLVNF